MGSKKRSQWAKQKAAFRDSLVEHDPFGLDDAFAQETSRRTKRSEEKEAALKRKACESKNRYSSKAEAEETILLCAEHGTTGLHSYRCPYCNGWHLTSKKPR